MKCLIFGCGRMGSAILKGILRKDLVDMNFSVIEPQFINDSSIINSEVSIYENIDYIDQENRNFDLVIIAVKPQIVKKVVEICRDKIKNDFLLISIAAGIKINFFESILGANTRAVRAMPNTPAEIGQGVTVLFKSANISRSDEIIAEKIFESVGSLFWIETEELMDVVTAISGSGPAYVFYIAEIMIDAALKAGLNAGQAELMVLQMMKGAGCLLREISNKTAKELREEVTSPGGTTEAALKVLMLNDVFSNIMQNAVSAAIQKSKELSKNN